MSAQQLLKLRGLQMVRRGGATCQYLTGVDQPEDDDPFTIVVEAEKMHIGWQTPALPQR
jgi:hypothetical protein